MYILGIILILMLFVNNKFLLYFKINSKINMIDFIDNFKFLKDKLTPLTINIAYKLLYCVSLFQIQLYKLKNYISPKLLHLNTFCDKYLKDKGLIVDTSFKQLLLIDDNGNKIHDIFIENEDDIKFIENECNKLNYSGIILLDKVIDKNSMNYVFYEKFPKSFVYKVSNIKFIAIDLDYNNNKYLINLKDNNNNYYIVNNCLNKLFFKYYIRNILKFDINEDNFDYNVTIIDNNVSIFNLLPDQSIIINEDDYNIYPVENSKYDTENVTNDELLNNSDSDKSEDYVKLEPIK